MTGTRETKAVAMIGLGNRGSALAASLPEAVEAALFEVLARNDD